MTENTLATREADIVAQYKIDTGKTALTDKDYDDLRSKSVEILERLVAKEKADAD